MFTLANDAAEVVADPSVCKGKWGGVYGHWVVDFQEAACAPYFSKFENKVSFLLSSWRIVNPIPFTYIGLFDCGFRTSGQWNMSPINHV